MGIDPVTHKPFSQMFSDYGNISGIPNYASFDRTLNNNTNLIPNQEQQPSSILPSPSFSSLNINPNLQNSFTSYNHPWDFQSNCFNEVSSACSSSSSTSFNQLTSPPPQPPITPSSPCLWSEFLSADFEQQQQEEDGKFANGYEDFGSYENGALKANKTKNFADASSSSATSFVDGILDKDREMRSQFPQLLDPTFEY